MKKLCLGWKSGTIREQNLALFSRPKRGICVRTLSVVDVKSFSPPPFSSLSPLNQKTWWTFPLAFSFHPEDWFFKNYDSFSIVKLLHFRISPRTSHSLRGPKRSVFMVSKCNKHVMLSLVLSSSGDAKRRVAIQQITLRTEFFRRASCPFRKLELQLYRGKELQYRAKHLLIKGVEEWGWNSESSDH